MCEKSTRNDLNHAVQPKMALHRSSFFRRCSFGLANSLTNIMIWRDSELKKEIPVNNKAFGRLLAPRWGKISAKILVGGLPWHNGEDAVLDYSANLTLSK